MNEAPYSPISPERLQQGISIPSPEASRSRRVNLEDSAADVMTDLKDVSAVTIEPAASIDTADQRMKQRGVRMLLVVDQERRIVGLVTSTDLQGEKPMQHVQKYGGTHHDVLVSDIMVPQQGMDVLKMSDVERACVGNIVATLQAAGRQHALVVDRDGPDSPQHLRGIFSASQIARQLDSELQIAPLARTFAEVESLVAHS